MLAPDKIVSFCVSAVVKVPQLRENFTVILNNPTGQAQLGPYNNATIAVISNDFAISFNGLYCCVLSFF
jgi:hypothetical protein